MWNDVYMKPENHGLKIVGDVEWDGDAYAFNLTVVWEHSSGVFYVGQSAGCSCPSPFENVTSVEDLLEFSTAHEVMDYILTVQQAEDRNDDLRVNMEIGALAYSLFFGPAEE